MLCFPVLAEIFRSYFSTQINVRYYFTSISLLTLVGRDSRPNYILKQELRRYEPRSQSSKKSPFRPHFRAFYPHPANKSLLRAEGAEGATHFLAPGKRGWPPTSIWPLFSRPTLHARPAGSGLA